MCPVGWTKIHILAGQVNPGSVTGSWIMDQIQSGCLHADELIRWEEGMFLPHRLEAEVDKPREISQVSFIFPRLSLVASCFCHKHGVSQLHMPRSSLLVRFSFSFKKLFGSSPFL